MTIARAQMYRQLYQLGGIGTLPMDYGQPLQIPQQQQPMFTTTGSATSSPMLNYGQTGLGQAGGTPLSRSGYQEGGLSDFYKGEEPIIPRIENIGGLLDQAEKSIGQPQNNFTSPLATTFSRFGMQEGGMGMMQPQTPQMDPKQALELIIQMLIEQGIPPEQAREIAIQMVQAVAEGGMGEMEEERIEARFGGRISNGREQYGIGSFFKGVGKAVSGVVKGVTNAVKKVVKSDLGKAALTVAAIYASGGGFSPEGFSLFGTQGSTAGGLLGAGGEFGLGQSYLGQGLFGAPTVFAPGTSEIASFGSKGLLGNLGLTSGYGANLLSGGISSLIPSKSTLLSLGAGVLGGVLGGGGLPERQPGESDEDYQARVDQWKSTLQSRLDQPNPQFAGGLYPNNPFYPQRAANGGRIGYQEGGIGNLIKQITQQEFFQTPMMANGGRMQYGLGDLVRSSSVVSATSTRGDTGGSGGGMFGNMISKLISQNPNMFKPIQMTSSRTDFIDLNQDGIDDREQAAYGGRMGYALGAEVPTRENQAGVQELDYRQTGGFVPPIGIKEKADDIPAMLSNNEFVFTADAVRNAGGGNVNKGAERMYTLMKNLEAGGRV